MKLLLNYDYNLFPFTTASYIEDAAYEIKGIEVMHRNDYQMRKPDLILI